MHLFAADKLKCWIIIDDIQDIPVFIMLALCKFVNLGNTHHIDEEHELYGNVKWQIFGFLLVLKKNVIFKV